MGRVIAKSLDEPDRSQAFPDGSRRSRIDLPAVSIGRGVYQPGWRWSAHARPLSGADSAAHVGYVVSGRMVVRGADGMEVEIGPGEAFEVPAGHDAWIVGDEPCVALDFAYAGSSRGSISP